MGRSTLSAAMMAKTKEWLAARHMIFSIKNGNKSRGSILPDVPLLP